VFSSDFEVPTIGTMRASVACSPEKAPMTPYQPHLLLVDDDPAAIRVMQTLLSEYPNQQFALSGPAALSIARDSRPDLILLDMNLPGMSGLEVCDVMRADPTLSGVPIIMVTAQDRAELEVLALERGASDFVSKPLQADQFRARVRAQLCLRRAMDQGMRGRPALSPTRLEIPEAPRLLVVDDDVAAILALRSALEHIGQFYFATASARALQLVRMVEPDLILLDAHMPGIDGFELCRLLKTDPASRHVPVVFVTRFSDAQSEAKALDIGAADFVSKPYTAAVLQARVRNLLELKRRYDEDLRSAGERWRQLGDARVADIVRAASDGIVSADAAGRIVLANAAAGGLFGSSQERLIGQPLGTFLPHLAEGLDTVRPGTLRLSVMRADGQEITAEAAVSRTEIEGQPVTTLVLRDVTERERVEGHERARLAAETANLTKTRLLSHIAHEMGNPLNGVLGFIQLARSESDSALSPQQNRWLEKAHSSAQGLETLLRDLLEMGRRDSAEFAVAFVPVDMGACLQQAVDSLELLARGAHVDVRCASPSEPVLALADARRLHQCLVNLISNGIKYNHAGGSVEVAVTAGTEKVVITVRDDGAGMSAEQAEQLFKPYSRPGGRSAEVAGTGLGLVITRQLIEAMHGSVRVASVPGKGSCFTILLPLPD
jgi:PAS domain S-box-containing protein